MYIGAPYRGSIKQQSLSDEPKSSNKSVLGQRVMSAKMLRFKQLQNQLADAHYHLNVSFKRYSNMFYVFNTVCEYLIQK